MPDRMPEDMPDRMPEGMPATKRMDVMVGVTRIKVFFWRRAIWSAKDSNLEGFEISRFFFFFFLFQACKKVKR